MFRNLTNVIIMVDLQLGGYPHRQQGFDLCPGCISVGAEDPDIIIIDEVEIVRHTQQFIDLHAYDISPENIYILGLVQIIGIEVEP